MASELFETFAKHRGILLSWLLADKARYRGTSLIRNTPILGPYIRTLLRVLCWF